MDYTTKYTLSFIFFIIVLFLNKPNKKDISVVIMIISSIAAISFFCDLNLPFEKGHLPQNTNWATCISCQKYIMHAIKEYNHDQKNSFPVNVAKSEFDKQIDLLIQTNCAKDHIKEELQKQYNKYNCSYEIINGDLYCSVHGSSDEKSPKFDKNMAQLREKQKEKNAEREFIDANTGLIVILLILALINALKYLFFVLITEETNEQERFNEQQNIDNISKE